jgi:phage tail protein E
LPRVTQPVLHRADFDTMEVADFVELAGAAVSFLGKNSDPTETEATE